MIPGTLLLAVAVGISAQTDRKNLQLSGWPKKGRSYM